MEKQQPEINNNPLTKSTINENKFQKVLLIIGVFFIIFVLSIYIMYLFFFSKKHVPSENQGQHEQIQASSTTPETVPTSSETTEKSWLKSFTGIFFSDKNTDDKQNKSNTKGIEQPDNPAQNHETSPPTPPNEQQPSRTWKETTNQIMQLEKVRAKNFILYQINEEDDYGPPPPTALSTLEKPKIEPRVLFQADKPSSFANFEKEKQVTWQTLSHQLSTLEIARHKLLSNEE